MTTVMATDIPRPIQATDIAGAIRACGIDVGQTVFVHSFLGAFGPIGGGLDGILSGFREAIGETGTLILPTYNYAFCGGEGYDHTTTPSTVGQITEHFRNRKGVVRTLHPVYSHAVEGPKSHEYAANPSPSGFGADSFFAKLKRDNAVFIFFGVSIQYATFVHHIEEMSEVPYRFQKIFHGRVTQNGTTSDYEARIFSRYLDVGVELDMQGFQSHLLGLGLLRTSILGRGRVMALDAETFFEEGSAYLRKHPFGFLREPIILDHLRAPHAN